VIDRDSVHPPTASVPAHARAQAARRLCRPINSEYARGRPVRTQMRCPAPTQARAIGVLSWRRQQGALRPPHQEPMIG